MIHRTITSVSRGWEHRAACRGVDGDLFAQRDDLQQYGNRAVNHPKVQQALALCARCPVIEQCEERRRASTDIAMVGVWAGRYWTYKQALRGREGSPERTAS